MRQREPSWVELKPRHQRTTRGEMACKIGHDRRFTTRRQEDHDIPRQHNGVKQVPVPWHLRPGQLNRREIAFIPGEMRRFATCHSQHGSVEIDSYDVNTTACQLDRHSARTTPGVEYGRYPERCNKLRFAVYIVPALLQSSEACLIHIATWHVCRPQPTVAHRPPPIFLNNTIIL